MSSSPCKRCGIPAKNRCSRCQNVCYCSVECQRSDWKRHKRDECIEHQTHLASGDATTSSTSAAVEDSSNEALLPANFMPQNYLTCVRCERHFMLCQCGNAGGGAHHDLTFVILPPHPPAHFTVMQRINRWALLLRHHPVLYQFNAVHFVRDLPTTFLQDLQEIKPIFASQMESYKKTLLHEHVRTLNMKLPEGYDQSCKDCDYVIEHFFAGNWGYPTVLEYTFLNNAIQQSSPKDFDPITREKFRNVCNAALSIHEMYNRLKVTNLNYRLEENTANDIVDNT